MVAVVSGNGLGLSTASLSTLGGVGASGTAAQGRAGGRVYVNSATGNLIIQGRDEYLGSAGLDVALIRTYNSQGYLNDDNGDNWRLGVHQRLHTLTGTANAAGSTITKTFGDGADVVYSYNVALGKYVSTDGNGAHDTLSYSTASQQWTWTDGSSQASETYDIDGRLTTSRDADGNTTAYYYANGLLNRIQDASGQVTWLDYTGNNLTQIRVESGGTTQTLTRYTYDSQNRLTEVKVDLSPADNSIGDNHVYVTTYTYDGSSKRVASIAQTDGTSLSFTYANVNGVYRVATYAENDGAPVTLPANTAALTTSEPQNTTNQHNLNTGAVTPQGWTTDGTLPSLVRYAANGNAIALSRDYVNGQHRIFVRNYSAVTGAWSAPITIHTVAENQLWELALDVDDAGNAVVAWQTSNGTNNVNSTTAWVSAATYDAATQTWSSAVVLHSIPTPNTFYLRYMLTAQIRGSEVVVAYEADSMNPPNNPYHTRSTTAMTRRNGVWSTATLAVTHSQNASNDNIVVRIAPNGDVLALYVVSDSETSGPFVPGEVFFSKLPAGSSTWNTPQLIGSRTNNQAPNETVIVDFEIDANGNGVLFWTTASTTTMQTQRYNAATGVWSAPESLPYGSEYHGLSVDHDGTAVWTYVANSAVYVRYFDPASGVWGAPILVPGSGDGAPSIRYPMAVIKNGRLAVSWSSYSASTGSRMLVSQRIDGVWTTPALARSGEIYVEPQMDEQGNIALGNSIYHPDSSYLIPAGATWASIAQTLYGSSAGASALQAALANPPLTAGTRLRNLPSTLSVTTTVMVPVTPYYTVSASDTWSSIAQAVYGTNDTNVVTALKNALGDPALTPGAHLTVPLSLSATPVGRITTLTYNTTGGVAGFASLNPSAVSTTDIQTGTANASLQTAALTSQAVTANRLNNFVPVTGISIPSGQWVYYAIQVPEGASELTFHTEGGSGDADIYVRRGAPPTTNTFDTASVESSNTETAYVAEPEAGLWYVGLRAYATVANTSLVANYQYDTSSDVVLTPGEAVTDLSGGDESIRTFRFTLPAGVTNLNLQLSGANGNADLYLMPGAPVDPNDPESATYSSSNTNSNEAITVSSPAAGTWYVAVVGWTGYSDARLILQTNNGTNTAPAIEAGATQTVAMGANVTLSATPTTAASYQWTQVGGPAVTLANSTAASAGFAAPAGLLGPTLLTFKVRATSSAGLTNTDIVRVWVNAPTMGYTVQASDSWTSIAQTLYGNANAAAALQGAMGSVQLAAGVSLTNLPSTLQYSTSTTITVPQYYTVKAGDTWASVARAIYGTTDSVAISTLQNTLGNPALTVGAHLAGLPTTLSFTPSGTQIASVDRSHLTTSETASATSTHNLVNGSLTAAVTGWKSPALLESINTIAAGDPDVAFDPSGNGFVIWRQGVDAFIRFYDKTTESWSQPFEVDALSATVGAPVLAVDEQGNGIAAWVQVVNGAASLFAVRYDAATRTVSSDELVESISGAVSTVSGSVALAIRNGVSTVSWIQSDGTNSNLYVARHQGTGWSTPVAVETLAAAPEKPAIAINAAGDTIVLWQQNDGTAVSIYANRYSAAGASWSGATTLESATTAAVDPKMAFDANGNGFAVWSQGADIIVRRFDQATGAWGNPVVIDNGAATAYAPTLSVDAQGNALVAWVQASNGLDSAYVARYNAATATWGSAQLLETVDTAGNSVANVAGNIVASINGDAASVVWLQSDGTRNDVYAARYSGGTWGARTLLETRTNAASFPAVAVDSSGNILALWQQSNGQSESIYAAAYNNDSRPYYTANASSTWSSIAAAVYGVPADKQALAGEQLRVALGSPALGAGVVLKGFPPSLSVTTTVTTSVTPYYTIQQGDTAASLTQKLYGVSTPAAVTAFSGVVGPLVPGNQLQVPATLSYAGASSGGSGISTQTDIQSPTGQVTTLITDSQGQLLSMLSPTVNGARLKQNFTYDVDGNVTSITVDPDGANQRTDFEYDANGNLTLSRDALGRTVTRTYNSANQLITESAFSVADPDGTGPGQPAGAMTSRSVYDSEQHLRFTVSADGRVVEYRYDSAGNRVAVLKYAVATYDVSALSPATSLSAATLETWAASQNLTQVERTDYTYDFRGNVSTATTYEQTNSSGAGVASTAAVTQFVYDQRGNLLQTIDARGSNYVTNFTYDGLGRLLTTSQWQSAGVVTTTVNTYDDVHRQSTTTLANGLVTTNLYDRNGRLVSVAQSDPTRAYGTTTYGYDSLGRIRLTTDAAGQTQHVLYDAAGRQSATIDADGTLTEYIYDGAGQLVKTVVYFDRLTVATRATLVDGSGNATEVSVATLAATLTSAPGYNASLNRITRAVYDRAGQLVFAIDPSGAVTQSFYDGAGRLTDVVEYATRVAINPSVNSLAPADVAVTSTAQDRRIRNFHSGDGALIATLDAGGYLVTFTYDGAGHLIRQTGYANPTPVQYRSTGTLTQLIPAASASDVVSYFLYDGEGRRVGVVDAEKYLTETGYDNAGNLASVTRYATAVNYSGSESLGSIRPGGGVSHSTTYQYDGVNNLSTETDHHGVVTSHTYNSVGQIIATAVAAGTDEQRSVYMRYDGLGRIVAELTAEGVTKITSGMSQAQIDLVWSQYGVRHVYDSVGRHISSTDQNGYTTLFFHDLDGRLTHTVNALGEVTEAIYNGLGQLSQQIVYTNRISVSGLSGGAVSSTLTSRLIAAADASKDAKTTFTYTQTGQVASSETATGAITTHAYNAFGEERERLDKLDSTRSLRQEFSYNTRGLLTLTRSDPNGFNTTVSAEYDAFGRAITVTDARSHSTHYEYDRLGRQIATVDAVNSRRTTSYDAFSRTLTTCDGRSNVTQYVYDDALRTTTLTTPEQIVVRTTYNRLGQAVSVTAAGNTTTYTYTENGDLETVVDNLGTLESHQYDRAGRELVQVNARGVSTSISYDAANRVLTRIVDSTSASLTTTYTYDGQGRVTRVSEPNGRITDTTYDAGGRVTLVVIDPDGLNLRTSYEYNLAGDVITVTEGVDPARLARTRYEYDVLGRRTKEVVELERSGATVTRTSTTLYSYDANGNLSRKIDGNNAATWYVYDAADNLRFSVDALGGVTENTYDADGRVIGVKRFATAVSTSSFGEVLSTVSVPSDPARDRFTQTVYDRDGRAAYTIDTLGGVTQRIFDATGNVARERVFSAKVAQATYTSIAAIEGALTAVGNNVQQAAAADQVGWTVYDVRGRAVFRVNGDYSVVRSVYDGNGNVTATTAYATRIGAQSGSYDLATLTAWANGSGANAALDRTTLYWYDGVDRLRFTRDAEGFMHENLFNDATRTEKEILHRNVSTMTAANSYAQVAAAYASSIIERQTTTVRDVAGRVTDVIDINGNFDHYTYDEVGNQRTFQNKAGNVWVYDYDANHRLISETGPAIDVTTVYVDGNGRLASQTSQDVHLVTTMTYDALGNLKTRTEAANTLQARTTAYTYDALGRQIRADFPSVLVYNAAADNQNAAGAAEASTPLYSEVAYDTLGNAFRSRDIGGAYSFKVYDALGRVIYDVDAANNVTQYAYDTFGNQTLLLRYANPLQLALPTNTASLTAAQVTGNNNLQPNADADRKIETAYDRLDRVVTVTQSVELNYQTNAATAGGHSFNAAATTKTEYDAFGAVARTLRLVDPSVQTWAETTYYYDRLGRKSAEIDALGYATQYFYDNSGNVTRKTEFARQAARGATFVPPAAGASRDTLGLDRIYSYVYDKLDRLVSESLTNYEYRTNPYEAHTTSWNKTYGYDLLGNQTTAIVNGAKSYTYYDAMGRALFVAGPMRHIGDVRELVTLVEMRRDAFGALVEQIQYANNASSPNETAPPFIAESVQDRHDFFQVNKLGQTVRTQDAAGVSRYASYTARGDVAKEWQTVTNNSTTQALVTVYQYDALGRQTAVIQPQTGPSSVVMRNSHYNAFGEIDRQWATVDGVDQASEYFYYDRAGRVWRTNSGDGVYKIYLYDLDGNATLEFRSQSADFNALASAASVLGLAANQVMRTETAYDMNGRAIQQRLPEYTIESTQELIDASPGIGVYPLTTPPNAVYQRIEFGDYSELYIASGAPYSQGGGWVQIQAPSPSYPQGLYSRVSEAEYSTSNVLQFAWNAPAQVDVVATFEYWLPSNPGVRYSVPVNSIFGSMFGVNIGNLPAGQYGYKISYTRTGATSAFATQEGTFDPTTYVTPTGGSSTQTQTAAPKITQVFDRWGNVISVTDAAQQTTQNYYNQFDALVRTVLPSVHVVDTYILITEFVDRPQNFYFYDQYGRFYGKVMGKTADAGSRPYDTYSYNEVGQQIAILHPGSPDQYLSSTTRSIYDAFGQVIQVTDEVGYRTRNTYDKAGRLIRVAKEVVQGGFANANDYADDTASNSNAVIYESYTYDEAGRRIAETNGEGEVTRYEYDLHGNLVVRRTPLGYETTYDYDFNGNKVAETDANGSTSTWSYNAFGVLTAHVSLLNQTEASYAYGWGGGTAYSYQYNRAGSLTLQTSTGGQHIEYSYDAAGHVKVINDTGTNVGRVTAYTYDAAGRKVRDTVTVNGDEHQDSRLSYDSHGRLSSVDDPDYRVRYEYDGAGNRTVITANYVDHTGAFQAQQDELLYRYDDRGFMTVSQGQRSADGIHIDTYAVTEAVEITYDARGLRTSVRAEGKRWNQFKYQDEFGSIHQGVFHEINPTYGRATEYYTYDGLGRLTTVGLETYTEIRDLYTNEFIDDDWTPETKLTRVFDKASRVVQEDTLFPANNGKHHRVSNSTFDDDGRLQSQLTYKDGVLESSVAYGAATPYVYEDGSWEWSSGYDAAGVLRGYSVAVYNNSGAFSYSNTFRMTYQLGESYQEVDQTVSVAGSGPLPGHTARQYNANGELIRFVDYQDQTRNRYFASDAQGNVLTTIRGRFDGVSGRMTVAQAWDSAIDRSTWSNLSNQAKAQHFFFADGKYVGSFGQLQSANGAFEANFDVNFTPISEMLDSAPGQVIAQPGDTLRGIAARVWGDATLWYLIAEANGLTDPDAPITEGLALTLPNEIVSLSNTASSFKPYDANEALGDTTPTQPAPPAPKRKKGCGVLGQILVIVVAIVVTYFTAGAASGAIGSALGVASTSTVATVAGGIVGAAAGSIASQAVAIGIGQQDSFSWKSVAAAALAAGLAPGASSLGGSFGGQVATAAINSAVNQGVNIALGLQEKFNWKAVAAAAIAAPLASRIGDKVGNAAGKAFNSKFAGEAVRGFTTGLTNQVAYASFTGGKINYTQLAADAFGNALGNSIVDGIQTAGVRRQAKILLEEAGYEYSRADHRSSAEFVESLVRQGATRDESLAILRNDEIRSGLLDNDFARSGGISDALAGQRASNFVDEFRRGGAMSAAGEDTLEEVVVTAATLGQSGSTITEKVFSGGVHLVEGLTQLNDQHPTLANFAFTAGKTLLTGGPLKTVVTKLANATFDGVIGDLRGQLSLQAQTATERFVTDIATRNNISFDVSLAGLTTAVGPNAFGMAAGQIAGGAVDTIFDARLNQIVDRGNNVRNVVRHETGDYGALKKGDVVGDGLENHHVPQKAVAKGTIPGYPQDKTAQSAPAIRLDELEHSRITAMQKANAAARRNMTPRQLLADDIKMLRSVGVPNAQLRELIDASKLKYGLAK